MNEKCIMENLLMLEKGACDLLMHATVESSTDNVHGAFESSLCEVLASQDLIYGNMQKKGWYPTENAPAEKINALKQKFASANN